MNATTSTMIGKRTETFERYLVGITAIIVAGMLTIMAVMGPLVLGIISYKTSNSALYQTQGQDLVNLILLVPLCVAGAILHLKDDDRSKYFLILVPIYVLLYTGYAYGVGMEWSNQLYTGNSEQFFWIFLILMIGSLILLFASYSMFTERDAPKFDARSLKIYITLVAAFLVMFTMMWFKEIVEVITTGNTSSGSYLESPSVFWVVKYLDLGITIPLGFIGLYLLGTRPAKAYPLILAFFGFFVTLSMAVNAMMVVMILNNDPGVQAEGLVIFPVLMLLSLAGFFYLVKDKIPRPKT
ncbi:MAG: hypothetical protein ACTSP4_13985 [Candidatus Hodarchaeales archaeon]